MGHFVIGVIEVKRLLPSTESYLVLNASNFHSLTVSVPFPGT